MQSVPKLNLRLFFTQTKEKNKRPERDEPDNAFWLRITKIRGDGCPVAPSYPGHAVVRTFYN